MSTTASVEAMPLPHSVVQRSAGVMMPLFSRLDSTHRTPRPETCPNRIPNAFPDPQPGREAADDPEASTVAARPGHCSAETACSYACRMWFLGAARPGHCSAEHGMQLRLRLPYVVLRCSLRKTKNSEKKAEFSCV